MSILTGIAANEAILETPINIRILLRGGEMAEPRLTKLPTIRKEACYEKNFVCDVGTDHAAGILECDVGCLQRSADFSRRGRGRAPL